MELKITGISDKEFNVLHNSTLKVLFEYGVSFEDEEAVGLLTSAGNEIDKDGRIHLKPEFVETTLNMINKEGFIMYGRDESKKLDVRIGKIAFRPSTGAPFILDYSTRLRRSVTFEDVKKMVLLVDALDGYDMVSAASPPNTPGSYGSLLAFINLHRFSTKVSDVTVMTGEEVKAIGKIAVAIRGSKKELVEKPLTAVNIAMTSPLECFKDQAKAFIEGAKMGMPMEVLTSPMMGVTSPLTISGNVVIAMAEYIAALCLVYRINPGLGMINCARVTPTNMRTAAVNAGTPEAGMASVILTSLCNRYFIPTNQYGFGTSARTVGVQSEMEKVFSGLLQSLATPHMVTGGGILDSALLTSPEQLVIDNEHIHFIKRILKPIDIDEESIGLNIIKNVKKYGNLLGEEHTIKYLKAGELMECSLGQWCSYQEWQSQGSPDLYDLAHKKVEEITSSHKVEDFDSLTIKEIDRITDDFRINNI